MTTLVGGIEAGGTKFVCAVGSGPDDLKATARFDTTSPQETVAACASWFREQQIRHGEIPALGVAAFGPLDLRLDSATYGSITSTPKDGWRNTPLKTMLENALSLPVAIDTDVNGAALGEWCWGAAQGLDTFVYLTIGTGIGGGAMVSGRLLHGMLHPEMGHILIPRDRQRDSYQGCCPYHGDCFEGLASGPAIRDRWKTPAESLPPDHEAWTLEAHIIALALVSIIGILSPQRVILGGGVMQQAQLFPPIRAEVQRILNGYVQSPEILEGIEQYIVPPGLGGRAGVLGALALGQQIAR